MSESTSRSVECPLCGEEFDPTAAGGWCTNSECGEWQYDGDIGTATDDEESADDESATEDVTEDPLFGDDSDDSDDELDLEDPTADDESEEPAAPDPEEADEDEPVDDEPATPEAEDEADELDACPACDTAVGPSDAFCPSCGEDLDAHRGGDDEPETLDACPSCGDDVTPDDAFCASCGEDLDAHREGDDEPETLDACPSCGDDVTPDDAFCASCGEDLDAYREGDAGGADGAPSTLALTAHGESVVVEDDEAVGRQIRSLLADAGQDEDQAVRIHREHVRFVREDDQFYVVDLGDNPTEVNGVRLSKGDREPIGPGDELRLSDVVTLDVEAP